VLAALAVSVSILILHAGPTTSGQSCQTREYVVTETGNILDRDRNIIGEVQPGDQVRVQNLDKGPYSHRYEATVLHTGQTGYIDQAKLRYIKSDCS